MSSSGCWSDIFMDACVFRTAQQVFMGSEQVETRSMQMKTGKCDIYEGSWVVDESYDPLYN